MNLDNVYLTTSMKRFLGDLRDELNPEDYKDPLAHLHWRDWLRKMFPDQVTAEFADYHAEFWDWVWDMKPGVRPDPFVAAWFRKGGKTSSIQMAIVALICRGVRRYCIYNQRTQPQADQKIQNIANLLERKTINAYYPRHAERAVNKYKASLGWNTTRLRTAGGGVVDSLGLTVAQRGAVIQGQPPDLVVIDDVDELHDSASVTKKHEKTIKRSILGAATSDAAVIMAQNLIIPTGIVSRVVKGRADYLKMRQVSGPNKAVKNLKTERVYDEERRINRDIIVGGEATWEGYSLEQAQARIDLYGLPAFLNEGQNEVEEQEGALWTRDLINETRRGSDDLPADAEGHPQFIRIVVGVDPSGGGDDIGIVVGGKAADGHCYILDDATQPGKKGSYNWGYVTVQRYDEYKADTVVAESNYGGDMVASNIRAVDEHAPVKMVSASRGKAIRAEPVRSLYERGLVHHVGSFSHLEAELTSWVPGETRDSPNRLDALVWVVTELMLGKKVLTGGAGSKRIGGNYR